MKQFKSECVYGGTIIRVKNIITLINNGGVRIIEFPDAISACKYFNACKIKRERGLSPRRKPAMVYYQQLIINL
jgi:hypothetical protein